MNGYVPPVREFKSPVICSLGSCRKPIPEGNAMLFGDAYTHMDCETEYGLRRAMQSRVDMGFRVTIKYTGQ